MSCQDSVWPSRKTLLHHILYLQPVHCKVCVCVLKSFDEKACDLGGYVLDVWNRDDEMESARIGARSFFGTGTSMTED